MTTHTVQVNLSIDGPAAWHRMRDFSVAHQYVPDLTGTRINTEQRNDVGASRTVFRTGGATLDETIVEWHEGNGFVIRLHQGDQPLKPFTEARFHYRLKVTEVGSSMVELAIEYSMPWGWLGRWLDRRLISPAMRKTLVQTAAGLKHYYETGRPATDDDRQAFRSCVRTL